MSIDHRIELARKHFNITEPSQWADIRPEWIKQIHNVGPRTLDLLRVYLAARGLTLKDDATVEFWQANLSSASVGGQIALTDNATVEEFTILIDSQEKHPWTFQGLGTQDQPIIIPYRWQSLGPSHGDYSVSGCETIVHVERKSIDDALGTFLSHGDRAERWENTMRFLAEIPMGCVVVEGTVGQCLASIKEHGKRSVLAMRNELIGSLISWQCEYGIQFWFIDSRRLAERFAYRFLKRGWRIATEQKTRKIPASEVIAELC